MFTCACPHFVLSYRYKDHFTKLFYKMYGDTRTYHAKGLILGQLIHVKLDDEPFSY